MHSSGNRANALNSALLFALIFTMGATARATVSVNPNLINFGNQVVGSSGRPIAVTLTNGSREKIRIVSVSASLKQFVYSGPSLPVTLNQGQSLTVSVTFAPTAAQAYQATLTFSRGNGELLTAKLIGTGVQALTPPPPIPSSPILPSQTPSLTTQPVSQIVNVGQTATFSAAAIGTAPLSYQWSKSGTAITGATAPSYTTAAATSADNGSAFAITISNAAGSVTSNNATLTVTSYTLNATPSSVAFSAQAGAPAPPAQNIIINDTTPGPLPVTFSANQPWITLGLTSATAKATIQLAVNPSGLAPGNYSGNVLVAASGVVNSPMSIPVSLNVAAATVAPSISTQPVSQTVTAGQTATFSVAVTGSAPLSYQWSKNAAAISGAISASYTTPASTSADNGALFKVTISNSAGSVSSNNATLTVSAALTSSLSANPSSLAVGNVNVGGSNNLQATLTNSGNANVAISNVSISGAGFGASGVSTGQVLTPGQTASLSVSFAPTATGSVTGSVIVASNASNSPMTIPLSGSGVQPISHSATLRWNASASTVTGYNVYRGTVSGGPYAKSDSSEDTTTAFSDTNVQAGQTYYYVVTSVNASGVESAYSNQVSATIPTP
jgi:hypothetical protein